jgi:tetratricopeptide (TPR) repeat protein
VELGIIVFDFALALVIGWQLQNVPFNSLCATAPVHVAADWTESPIKPEISGFVRRVGSSNNFAPVLVKLESPSGSLLSQTWTGKLGEFSFPEIACGNYVLAVDAVGYRPVRVPVEHSYIPLGAVFLNLVPANSEAPAGEESAFARRRAAIPGSAKKEYERGLEALSGNRVPDSVAHFRKAVDIYPSFDDAHIQLAWALIQQRNFAGAQLALQQALRLDGKSAAAFALLGRVRKDQARFLDAARLYDRSLSLEEASWRTHLEMGAVLLKLGHTDQACAHIVRAHELGSSQPLAHLQLYNCLVLQTNYIAAEAELNEFLKLFPNHSLAPRVRQQRDALLAQLQRASK